MTAAVTNARASADVEGSAAVSRWSQQAVRSLEQQELVDRLAVAPDAALRARYEETSAATRRAIEAMGSVGAEDHDDPVGDLGVRVYDVSLNDHGPERLGLLGQLRRAIDTGELVLHFQPEVALPGADVCGVEALVHWAHPQRGLVPPGEFVPLAEHTPLIRPLTRYVLDAALEQCARWRDVGRSLTVAVNVSARNLLDEHFAEEVQELLARRRLPASSLELEVTESAITADPDRARRILTRLADCGVTLSIDDFGAGYTSVAQLEDLPVHQLTIDRSFVARMAADPGNALIVRSVVELRHNLGLTTAAERVEDEATLDRLGAMGCDVAQGHHVCRPMAAGPLEAWLDATVAVRA